MAPEVFNQEKYDTKVDVFSFALILQEVTNLAFHLYMELYIVRIIYIFLHQNIYYLLILLCIFSFSIFKI